MVAWHAVLDGLKDPCADLDLLDPFAVVVVAEAVIVGEPKCGERGRHEHAGLTLLVEEVRVADTERLLMVAVPLELCADVVPDLLGRTATHELIQDPQPAEGRGASLCEAQGETRHTARLTRVVL